MDEFLTEEQEVDRAKQWLRENGTFLVAGVVLGLGGLFGWQQWQDYQLRHAGQASIVWEQMRAAIDGERPNEVAETLEILESEYAGTPYLDLGRLAIASMYLDQNAPDKAVTQLEQVIANSSDKNVRKIAGLRLGQVLLFQQQYDSALDVLNAEDESAFAPQTHELRGDVLHAKGDMEAARDEYLAALASPPDAVFNRDFVAMKLDDVTGALAQSDSGAGPESELAPEPEPAAVDAGAADE